MNKLVYVHNNIHVADITSQQRDIMCDIICDLCAVHTLELLIL